MKLIEENKKLKCGYSFYRIIAYIIDNKTIIFKKEDGNWLTSENKSWELVDNSISDEDIIEQLNKEKTLNLIKSKTNKKIKFITEKVELIKDSIKALEESDLIDRLISTKISSNATIVYNMFYDDYHNYENLISKINYWCNFLIESKNGNYIKSRFGSYAKYIKDEYIDLAKDSINRLEKIKDAFNSAILIFARSNKDYNIVYVNNGEFTVCLLDNFTKK